MASLDDSSIWGCRICAISTSGFKPTRQGLSAFTARKSGRPGCEGIIKKFAKKRHLRGIIKKLAIWREDSSSGWPPLIVTTPNTLRPQNREGEFSVNLLTFSFTKSQSIKFSRSPEDQYGSLGKYFSPNVYKDKDYFPRSMKTLKRKLYQHFMWPSQCTGT